MRIAIFGATGGVGTTLVRQALAAGHTVTASARLPEKIAVLRHPSLQVIQGDVLDDDHVDAVVRGQNAVLCAIGAGPKRSTLRAEGTLRITTAMQHYGVKRFVCSSALGIAGSRGNLSWFVKHVVVDVFLHYAFEDHLAQETIIVESGLDWTIVRPPQLTDGSKTGRYLSGFSTTTRDLKLKISKADVAHFMLENLVDDRHIHHAPGISY